MAMKKNMARFLLGLFLVIAFAVFPAGNRMAQAETAADAAKKEYHEFMKKQPSYVKYKIVDITGDKVPELITRTPREKAGKLKSHRFVFFTYVKGSMRNITTLYEKYKSIYYYPGSSVIVARSFSPASKPTYEYFKVTSSKMKLIAYSYYLKGKRHYVYKDVYYLKPVFDKKLAKVKGSRSMKQIKF